MTDKSVNQLKIRGWMLDAARLVEKPEYYRRTIDMCAEWNMNAIVFRLADDNGCSIHFSSHPELILQPNALTTAEMRALVEYADSKGVMLIPEVESFGHTGFITSVSEHADILDKGEDSLHATFTGVIPVHPKTLKIMADLYRETADIFSCPYIHAGCDEVSWGGSDMSKEAIAQSSRGEVWAGYINQLNGIAQKCGRELIIWDDHVIGRAEEEGALDRLDKTVILFDWNYWDYNPKLVQARVDRALKAGFRIIGGPTWMWCEWEIRAGCIQLINIDAYVDVYRNTDDDKNLGVVVCNWVPTRYLAGSIWDALVYSAIALNDGSAVARQSAFRLFVESHYGAKWNEIWADVFHSCYAMTPPRWHKNPAVMGPRMPIPWCTEEDLRIALATKNEYSPGFSRLRSQLVICESSVRRNLADFHSFTLSIRCLEHLFWRNSALLQEGREASHDAKRVEELIRNIAERDQDLLKALKADRKIHRFDIDEEIGRDKAERCGGDFLLPTFTSVAAYSAELASDPKKFLSILDQGELLPE